MEYKLFNLNDHIRVRLTDLGYQRLAELHNILISNINTLRHESGFKFQSKENRVSSIKSADDFKQEADSDGYTCFQAWVFMQKFGPVVGFLKPEYYHLDIQIKNTDLR